MHDLDPGVLLLELVENLPHGGRQLGRVVPHRPESQRRLALRIDAVRGQHSEAEAAEANADGFSSVECLWHCRSLLGIRSIYLRGLFVRRLFVAGTPRTTDMGQSNEGPVRASLMVS